MIILIIIGNFEKIGNETPIFSANFCLIPESNSSQGFLPEKTTETNKPEGLQYVAPSASSGFQVKINPTLKGLNK